MTSEAVPDQGTWTRETIDRVWDVLYQGGMEYDRESIYHDEGAESEYCERHRKRIVATLTEAGLVLAPVRDALQEAGDRMAGEVHRLKAENAELRAELGRLDDVLTQIGRVVKAYEASIGEETR